MSSCHRTFPRDVHEDSRSAEEEEEGMSQDVYRYFVGVRMCCRLRKQPRLRISSPIVTYQVEHRCRQSRNYFKLVGTFRAFPVKFALIIDCFYMKSVHV